MKLEIAKRRRLRRLRLDRVDGVPAGANPGAYVALHKSEQSRTNETGGTIEAMTDAEKVAAEKAAAEKAAAEKAKAEQEAAEKAKAEADEAAKAKDDVAKAEREALAKQLADAQAEIAKLREKDDLREYTELAKSDLGSLPEKPEVMGALLRKAKGALDDAEYQTLFRLLKAANAQADTSVLFKQFADENEPESKSIDEQITEKAQALVDAGKAATIEQATVKVLQGSPELRKAYGARQGI